MKYIQWLILLPMLLIYTVGFVDVTVWSIKHIILYINYLIGAQ